MLMTTALICMALNIYHEARDQPLAGQLAVAQVVVNRTLHEDYPSSVCSVVKQKHQFSWLWDDISDKPHEKEAWKLSQQIAKSVLAGRTTEIVEGATHYHATSVTPGWSKRLERVVKIDKHIFYRSPIDTKEK